ICSRDSIHHKPTHQSPPPLQASSFRHTGQFAPPSILVANSYHKNFVLSVMDLQRVLNHVSQDHTTGSNYLEEPVQADLPTLPSLSYTHARLPSIRDGLGEFFPQSRTAYPHA